MTIREIAKVLDAKICPCDESLLGEEVVTAFGSDMMSDVLAFADEGSVLLSGLLNSQTIRTAHMQEMPCIVIVRGKSATSEMKSLAENSHIVLMETDLTMYAACGRLYKAGLDNR